MTPVLLVIGQSNAQILDNSGALNAAVSALGSDAIVLGSHAPGSSLSAPESKPDWYPYDDGNPDTGELYLQMLADFAALQADVSDAEVTGIVWVQGERNVHSSGPANGYEAALTELVTRLGGDFGEDVPIAVVGLSDHMPAAEEDPNRWDIVQAAQVSVAEAFEHVTLIDPDAVAADAGYPFEDMARDGRHYKVEVFHLLSDAILSDPLFQTALNGDLPQDDRTEVAGPDGESDNASMQDVVADGDEAPLASTDITLYLIDTTTDQVIGTLEDGSALSQEILGKSDVSVIAVPSGEAGSVSFTLGDYTRTENVAPYAMFGNRDEDYLAHDSVPFPTPGEYTISVAVHTGRKGTGEVLENASISFSVGMETAPPTDDLPADEAPVSPVDEGPANDLPVDADLVYELTDGNDTPLDVAMYDPQSGLLILEFNLEKALDVTDSVWGDVRHIDAVKIGGDVYPLVLHDDNGPRDANGRYIFDDTTVETSFAVDVGAGRDPADGTLAIAFTDREDGTRVLYTVELMEESMLDDAPVEEAPGEDVDPVDPVDDMPVEDDLVQDTPADGITLALIDTSTGEIIAEISQGSDLPGELLGRTDVSVIAVPSGDAGSVVLTFGDHSKTENVAPYALFGDVRGNYLTSDDAPFAEAGDYAITVQAYSEENGSGVVLESTSVSFSVGAYEDVLVDNDHGVDDAPVDQPIDDTGDDVPVDGSDDYEPPVDDEPVEDTPPVDDGYDEFPVDDSVDDAPVDAGSEVDDVPVEDEPPTDDAPMDDMDDMADHMHMTNVVVEDNNAYLMAMGSGSRIEIHGADAEKESWSQLETSAVAGSNTITVDENTGWEIGDKIAIASTSDDWTESEEFTILDISNDGRTITLDGTLQHDHRGETVSYDNGQTGADFREWDMEVRAEVALLSRNVTIQGDEDSVEDGFGGHTMIMHGAEQHIEGAEFFRMGQEDILGRYPIHWHMLGDAEGQYVSDVSVHDSYQKGSTIHGTSKITYENNVIYDHVGHGVFFEDGSENDNHILGNLVFKTKESLTGEPIPTDGDHVSSYWIENPNNIFIGNHAAGSQSNGFWIIPARDVHGLSEDTFVGDPGEMSDLIFIRNVSHSAGEGDAGAGGQGMLLGIDGQVNDNLDFRQSTIDGEFAVVDDFTAYGGRVWSLSTDVVFRDFKQEGGSFFIRHENFVEDSVFDSVRQLTLYRDGGNQLTDVLLTGNTRLTNLNTDHNNIANGLNNVVLQENASSVFAGSQSRGFVNQQTTLDVDGSTTGIVGGFITPSGDGAEFKASPFAVEVDNIGGYVSPNTVGATEVTALGITGDVRVLRYDGEAINDLPESDDARRQGDDNNDRSAANYEFFTSTGLSADVAYLIDPDEMPNELTLNLMGVKEGDSAVYEIPGIAGSYRVTEGGERVFSFEELLAAEETVYYRHDDSGSVFVRIVANDLQFDVGRPVEDLLGDYRAEDSITMEISGYDASGAGSRTITQELLDAIGEPRLLATDAPEIRAAEVDLPGQDFVLDRYDSTSDTTEITGDMARWSEATTWDNDVPGVGDTVVIGPGQTVVLDHSVTVGGIIINGGELLVEDEQDIALSSDYVLVLNGGLFQVGTEDDLFEHDFLLTLEGDDQEFDLDVDAMINGEVPNTVMAAVEATNVMSMTLSAMADEEIPVIGMDDADMLEAVLVEAPSVPAYMEMFRDAISAASSYNEDHFPVEATSDASHEEAYNDLLPF